MNVNPTRDPLFRFNSSFPKISQNFTKERTTIKNLEGITDLTYRNRRINFSLDFLESISLKEAVEKQLVSFEQMNNIIFQITLYIFKEKNVHHDIKPDNIIISNTKITVIDEDRQSIFDFQINKSPTLSIYSHPQQRDYWNSKKVDFYSLGLILYFIFTGKDPDPGKDLKLETTLKSRRIEYILESICCPDLKDQYENAIYDFLIVSGIDYYNLIDLDIDEIFLNYSCGSVSMALTLLGSDIALDHRDVIAYIASEGFEYLKVFSPYKYKFGDCMEKYNHCEVAMDWKALVCFAYHNEDFPECLIYFNNFVFDIDSMNDILDFYYSLGAFGLRQIVIHKISLSDKKLIMVLTNYFDVNEINLALYLATEYSSRFGDEQGAALTIFRAVYIFKMSTGFGNMRVAMELLNELFFLILQCGIYKADDLSNFIMYVDMLKIQTSITAIDFYDFIFYSFPKHMNHLNISEKDAMMNLIDFNYPEGTATYMGIKEENCKILNDFLISTFIIILKLRKYYNYDEVVEILSDLKKNKYAIPSDIDVTLNCADEVLEESTLK